MSLSKTFYSLLSTGSTRKTHPDMTERLLMERKESNQTNKQNKDSSFFGKVANFFAAPRARNF